MTLTLTWKRNPRWRTARYELSGPSAEGVAFYMKGSRQYRAQASIRLPDPDTDFVKTFIEYAGTMRAAIGRLNAVLDRESIGLFGVDDIRFDIEGG